MPPRKKPVVVDRIDLEEGAYLRRRPNSTKWQLYAYVNGEEIRQSTGKNDVAEARRFAIKEIDAARQRQAEGKTALPSRFADVAGLYLKNMIGDKTKWDALALSKQEVKKRSDTRRVVLDYLMPYYGNEIGRKSIDRITDADLRNYRDWREEQRQLLLARIAEETAQRKASAERDWNGSKRLQAWHPDLAAYLDKIGPPGGQGNVREFVAASTLNSEVAVLKDIFDYAVKKDLISKKNLPDVEYYSLDDQELREGFTQEQVDKIRACARSRFKEAQEQAVDLFIRRQSKPHGLSPDFLELYRRRLKGSGEGWVSDHVAYSRFVLMCVVDIIAGSGMRPATLGGIKRWQVNAQIGKHELSPFDQLVSTALAARPAGQRPAIGRADSYGPAPPRYAFKGETRKGSNRKKQIVRRWTIVPERKSWPAIRMLLAHISKEDATPLLDITSHAVNNAFKKVLEACGCDRSPDGKSLSLYDLRHFYITKKLLEGVPIALVAKNTMTSVQMIEKHYNHLQTDLAFDLLAG